MDKAMEYIDKLAAKLGVAAEHVYGVLVKQQIINGAIGIVGTIAALIFLGIVFTKLLKKGIEHNKVIDSFDTSPYMLVSIPVGIALGITAIVGFFVIPIGINQMINPEYYAIKEILDTIGGK
ncbi:hypothetical protein P9E81_08480 [Bacillus licheniformis]|uniref:hypothetical protein n=1 Tax=Bacillus licheniformis TaxID=1402 RepID=UPI002DBF5161|nr:hypothetical protein [Bacillus licheniformis]MEC0777472.1 hypothetical protein [Bacillus licheniformis]MEC1851450.1 hypothetical protein [Bacillus licheniformis]